MSEMRYRGRLLTCVGILDEPVLTPHETSDRLARGFWPLRARAHLTSGRRVARPAEGAAHATSDGLARGRVLQATAVQRR